MACIGREKRNWIHIKQTSLHTLCVAFQVSPIVVALAYDIIKIKSNLCEPGKQNVFEIFPCTLLKHNKFNEIFKNSNRNSSTFI